MTATILETGISPAARQYWKYHALYHSNCDSTGCTTPRRLRRRLLNRTVMSACDIVARRCPTTPLPNRRLPLQRQQFIDGKAQATASPPHAPDAGALWTGATLLPFLALLLISCWSCYFPPPGPQTVELGYATATTCWWSGSTGRRSGAPAWHHLACRRCWNGPIPGGTFH